MRIEKSKARTRALTSVGGAALLTSLGFAPAVCAQEQTARFEIPAQPMSSALLALGRQAGVSVAAPRELVEGKTGQAVRGEMTTRQALTQLLGGSGLSFRFVSGGAVSISGPQDQAAADAPMSAARNEPSTVDTLVVTGTRVQRTGFTAPTPMTTVGAEELQRTATVNPADYLNQYVPSFAPTQTPSTSIVSTLRPGGNAPDMRNLGARRTLVLVDGRRHVATSPLGTIDLDAIPSALIDRIEVVTGGASAAYGSDAVAGVVNLIFKRNFEGLEGGAQYGISDNDDNETVRFNLAYGASLLDGRANLMVGADYVDRKGIVNQGDRGWGRHDRQIVTTTGNPSRVILADVNRVVTPGGLIVTATAGPGGSVPAGFVGTNFGPGGSIAAPFTFGGLLAPLTNPLATQVGGSGVPTPRDLTLAVPSERYNFMGRGTFEITENVTAYAEGSYAYSSFRDNILYSGDGTNTVNTRLFTIRQDYAFLPAAIRNTMVANNITSFQLARLDLDFGPLGIQNEDRTYRFVLGLEGQFKALAGDWRWDAYWQRGRNKFYNGQINNRQTTPDRQGQAADAILVNGVAACRDAAARAAGCQPLNLIGTGPQMSAALDYFLIDTWSRMTMTEDVFAANISGEPFSTWAGPVSIATGVEYRKDRYRTEADPYTTGILTNIATLLQTNPNPPAALLSSGLFVGSTPFNIFQPGRPFMTAEGDVKEIFGETVVPLARDQPFAELLEFNGAVRRTDYSESGKVTTWKLGLNWKPISDLRVRGTLSRDIRAPNLNELYSLGVGSTPTVSDPVTSSNYVTRARTGGNQDLVPERADTMTFGVVWQPSFISGFQASIDYYEVDIKDAIGALTPQQIVDRCAAGDQTSCALIQRDPTQPPNLPGATAPFRITLVTAGQTNSQRLKTRGWDFEAAYTTPLSDWWEPLDGDLSFRLLGNHVSDFINAGGLDLAGSLGTGQGGVPRWRGTFTALYDRGPLSVSTTLRYIGAGTYNATLPAATMAPLHIPEQTLVDASIQYDIISRDDGRRVQLYAYVQNLLDRDPPLNPSTGFNAIQANAIFHDVVGRMFSFGVRFSY